MRTARWVPTTNARTLRLNVRSRWWGFRSMKCWKLLADGVRDEEVEAPEALLHLVEHRVDLLEALEIGADRHPVGAEPLDLGDGVGRRLLVAACS